MQNDEKKNGGIHSYVNFNNRKAILKRKNTDLNSLDKAAI